jgi:hypothetical protein
MGFSAACFRELLRPTSGIYDPEDSDEMADLAAFELATAVNLHIRSLTEKK